MAGISLSQRSRELEAGIRVCLSSFDIDSLPLEQREFLQQIKRQASDVRLDVRDYEYAETRSEQLEQKVESAKRLEKLQKDIVKLSQYGFFSALDVATFSTQIQQIISKME